MTVDYDAPRRTTVEADDDSLDELAVGRNGSTAAGSDIDEGELVESYELPGADLSGEELVVRVLPKQPDEFTCRSCFLVHHRSRLAGGHPGDLLCKDCA